MKISHMIIIGLIFLCFAPNFSPGLVWIIGTENGTLIVRESGTNSLYKINEFDQVYKDGGEKEKPLLIQDDLLLSKTPVGEETAYVVYKSDKVIRTTILEWSVIYPVFYKEEAILFLEAPAIGAQNSTLKKIDFKSGELQEIPEITGTFIYKIVGSTIVYGQVPNGAKYPTVNIYRQNVFEHNSEADLLLKEVHVENVFSSQSGRFIAYNDRTISENQLKLIDTQTRQEVDVDHPGFWERQHQVSLDEEKDELIILGCRSHVVTKYAISNLLDLK